MSIRQKASTTFPDIEKIQDPVIRQTFSDLFKVLQVALTDSFDDTNQAARWKIDGTETQLETADEIDMQSKKIINVTDPTAAQDASTKTYTDTKISKTTAAEISVMTEKTVLADGDHFVIEDSAASNAKKRVQKSNIANDKISKTIAGEIAAMTEKTSLADGDHFLIEDSAAGNAKKRVLKSNVASPVLSNALFEFEASVDNVGYVVGTTLTTAASANYAYRAVNTGATYLTVARTKFKKISGVSTVTVYAQLWQGTASGEGAGIRVSIGSANGAVTGTTSQITPEWVTFTINVSSLVNGTVYDVTADLRNATGAGALNFYLGNLMAFGS